MHISRGGIDLPRTDWSAFAKGEQPETLSLSIVHFPDGREALPHRATIFSADLAENHLKPEGNRSDCLA